MTIKIKCFENNYEVNDRNQIHQPELNARWKHLGLPQETWVLEGAVEIRFSQVVATYSVEDIRKNKVPWKWRSGRQRCFILHKQNGVVKMWKRDVEVVVK